MVTARPKESWELAAEELVRRVRVLLDHRDVIEKALTRDLGASHARASLDQIEHLIHVLELELWRKHTQQDRQLVEYIVRGLKTALTTAGIALSTLVATDVYEALTAAHKQADKVVECVIEGQATTDEPSLPRREGKLRRSKPLPIELWSN